MHSIIFVVASVALFVVCASAPVEEDVIQHIPQKHDPTPSATLDVGSVSGAAVDDAGASKAPVAQVRARRDIGGQESDLLPSANEIDSSAFGETSQLAGRSRIRVLPAFLG